MTKIDSDELVELEAEGDRIVSKFGNLEDIYPPDTLKELRETFRPMATILSKIVNIAKSSCESSFPRPIDSEYNMVTVHRVGKHKCRRGYVNKRSNRVYHKHLLLHVTKRTHHGG